MDSLANISNGTVLMVVGILLAMLAVLHFGFRGRDRTVAAIEENVKTILGVVVIVFLIIRPFIFQAYYIPSESMEPTLKQPHLDEHGREVPGDRLVADKLLYHLRDPQRGEIAIFLAPLEATPDLKKGDKPKEFVKRVIGIPGDTIEVVPTQFSPDGSHKIPGYVKRNGVKLDEPYIKEPPDYPMAPVHLGPHEYFMMGDNRNWSADSHVWGPLSRERFVGRVEILFWPLQRARVLHYWLLVVVAGMILGWAFLQQLIRRLRPPSRRGEPATVAPAVP